MSGFRLLLATLFVVSSFGSVPAHAAPGCAATSMPWTSKASCVMKWDPGSALLIEADAASTASGPPAWVRIRVVLFTESPNGTVTIDPVPLASCAAPPEEGARAAGCGAVRSALTGPTGTKISVLCLVEGAISGAFRCH